MKDPVGDLLRRADAQGVWMDGITPTRIHGRGLGLVATRDLEGGTVVMTIPLKAIRSLHTIPKSISGKLSPDMSIHGLLAADLTLHHSNSAEWTRLVPTRAELEATIPFFWPEELQRLLPAEAMDLLAKQQANFEKDWNIFKKGYPKRSRDDYLYHWFLISTRTFYYETSATLRYPWHDRLAMLPLADLFNHAQTGCSVSFSTEGYTITADRDYQAGDEISTSYGEHSNDYLLAEYGFLLRENQWDNLCLDEVILRNLNEGQQRELKDNGYMGNFMLHAGSKKSDNVWVALRLICSKDTQWQSYIDGEEDVEGTMSKATALLPVLLKGYLKTVEEVQEKLGNSHVGADCQREMLLKRWEQIQELVKQVVANNWTTG